MAALLTTIQSDVAARGSLQRNTTQMANAMAALELNCPLTAAGTTTATVTSQAKTANTLTFLIAGVFKSKGATDNFWTLGVAGSNTLVAANSFQKYLLLIDGSGTATVQEGTQSNISAAAVTWTNVSGVSPWSPLLSILNVPKCIVSVLTIATDATHTFTPGTTLFGAAGITATFTDGLDQSLIPLMANQEGLLIGNTI